MTSTARRPQGSEELTTWAEGRPRFDVDELDVDDEASVADAVGRVLARHGSIDVLVNNAGIGYTATVEDTDMERARALYETNVLGPWRCAQAVLPSMRARARGVIVTMSSVMSSVPMLGQAAYVSSKAALSAWSRCLAAEVARHGIDVVVVEPSVVHSKIFEKNVELPPGSDYGWAYEQLFDFYGRALRAAPEADTVGAAVAHAVSAPHSGTRLFCGWNGQLIGIRAAETSGTDWVRLGTAPDVAGFRAVVEELLGIPAQKG